MSSREQKEDQEGGEMSIEDFKAHLYHSLDRSGFLKLVKSQMRNRLATELHKSLYGSPSVFSSSGSPRKSMKSQLMESIVAEYLKRVGHEYTLSIFLPESDTNMGKLFTREEALNFLRIPPPSKLHKSIMSHEQRKYSFLESLLNALMECSDDISNTQPPQSETPTQTLPEPSTPAKKPPVVVQLEALDRSYASRVEAESAKSRVSLEDRLAGFQADLEARYKKQLETELSLYKTRELAKIRQDEQERYKAELAKVRENLKHAYQVKLEEAKKTEQDMMKKYRRKEQDLEAEIFSQRQTLLHELDTIRVKEAGMKRQQEIENRTQSLENERIKARLEQLEIREKNLEQRKKEIELMAERKIQKDKAEYELELQTKQVELARWEAQLKVDSEEVSTLKFENKRLSEQLETERKAAEKLQEELQGFTWRQATLEREREESHTKLNEHHEQRQKISALQRQLTHSESKYGDLKTSHKQLQHTTKQLQARLSQPNLEVASLRAELDQLQRTRQKEKLVSDFDNKQLRRQLEDQASHTLQLQMKLDEQLIQLRSAQREVQDLQSLLEHTIPLSSQLGKNQAKGRPGNKSSHLPSKRHSHLAKSPGLQQRPIPSSSTKAFTPQPVVHSTVSPPLADTLPFTEQKRGKSLDFFDSTGQFLAESRATINRMEEEAQLLERTYLNFNSQMLSGGHEAAGPLLSFSLPSEPLPLPVQPVLNLEGDHALSYHHNREHQHHTIGLENQNTVGNFSGSAPLPLFQKPPTSSQNTTPPVFTVLTTAAAESRPKPSSITTTAAVSLVPSLVPLSTVVTLSSTTTKKPKSPSTPTSPSTLTSSPAVEKTPENPSIDDSSSLFSLPKNPPAAVTQALNPTAEKTPENHPIMTNASFTPAASSPPDATKPDDEGPPASTPALSSVAENQPVEAKSLSTVTTASGPETLPGIITSSKQPSLDSWWSSAPKPVTSSKRPSLDSWWNSAPKPVKNEPPIAESVEEERSRTEASRPNAGIDEPKDTSNTRPVDEEAKIEDAGVAAAGKAVDDDHDGAQVNKVSARTDHPEPIARTGSSSTASVTEAITGSSSTASVAKMGSSSTASVAKTGSGSTASVARTGSGSTGSGPSVTTSVRGGGPLNGPDTGESPPASPAKKEDTSNKGFEVDPIMLKYMQLVQQKREQQSKPQLSAEPSELQVPSEHNLSAAEPSSIADSSSHGDPFEDW